MQASPPDLAQVRLDNALALFEEFVRATARHADAATLRGLEKRFAERVQIQPSYWSQIKGRGRQIGERLARQFEHLCHKPRGWMDVPHGPGSESLPPPLGATLPADYAAARAAGSAAPSPAARDDSLPHDDDERFIVGLVLTYYRRHPQRARTRLLDLLGEVLTPTSAAAPGAPPAPSPASRSAPDAAKRSAGTGASPGALGRDDAHALWLKSQSGVAPLKRKK